MSKIMRRNYDWKGSWKGVDKCQKRQEHLSQLKKK